MDRPGRTFIGMNVGCGTADASAHEKYGCGMEEGIGGADSGAKLENCGGGMGPWPCSGGCSGCIPGWVVKVGGMAAL